MNLKFIYNMVLREMTKRSYNQYCALAHSLDIVGERWTLLLVRDLLTGPKRFTDLLRGLPGIGTNLLTSRLKELEEAGILQHDTLPPPAASAVYQLTELGLGLKPAVVALSQWGLETLGSPRKGDHFRSGWSVLAMHSVFRPDAAGGLKETYEFRIGDEVFHARVNDGNLETGQGAAWEPALVIMADPETFLAVASRQLKPMDALGRGALKIQGDPQALARASKVFGLNIP